MGQKTASSFLIWVYNKTRLPVKPDIWGYHPTDTAFSNRWENYHYCIRTAFCKWNEIRIQRNLPQLQLYEFTWTRPAPQHSETIGWPNPTRLPKHKGYGSDKTLTLVDNIPVLNTGHYYNIISGLNELYFDEFTLFKNQFPTSYGNALGGHGSVFIHRQKNNATLRTTSNLFLFRGGPTPGSESKTDREGRWKNFIFGYQWRWYSGQKF